MHLPRQVVVTFSWSQCADNSRSGPPSGVPYSRGSWVTVVVVDVLIDLCQLTRHWNLLACTCTTTFVNPVLKYIRVARVAGVTCRSLKDKPVKT